MSRTEAELRGHLAGAAGDWVAERTGEAAGRHPDVDELTAYHGGTLGEDEARRIQDHLVTCRECLEHLLELDSFAAPAPPPAGPDTGAADFETAAAWRAMRSRLPAGPERARDPGRARLPAWVAALAAALAVAVLGLALFSLGRSREATLLAERLAEASQPQSAVVRDLKPPSEVRGGGQAPKAIELPASGQATLIVHLPRGARYGGYEMEIVDSSGRRLWSGGGFEASRFGTLDLWLPQGYLPPGDYSLHVHGVTGAERHRVESYAVRVPGS